MENKLVGRNFFFIFFIGESVLHYRSICTNNLCGKYIEQPLPMENLTKPLNLTIIRTHPKYASNPDPK